MCNSNSGLSNRVKLWIHKTGRKYQKIKGFHYFQDQQYRSRTPKQRIYAQKTFGTLQTFLKTLLNKHQYNFCKGAKMFEVRTFSDSLYRAKESFYWIFKKYILANFFEVVCWTSFQLIFLKFMKVSRNSEAEIFLNMHFEIIFRTNWVHVSDFFESIQNFGHVD